MQAPITTAFDCRIQIKAIEIISKADEIILNVLFVLMVKKLKGRHSRMTDEKRFLFPKVEVIVRMKVNKFLPDNTNETTCIIPIATEIAWKLVM